LIEFNIPPVTGKEIEYVSKVINGDKKVNFICKCTDWMENRFDCQKIFLTSSGTHALEMAALLIDIQKGDEIIMPSFTFPSSANAFILRGAEVVFVDIRPDTLNIDEKLIEDAITDKTKAIVPVHYGGVSCDMDTIMEIARKHNVYVIEDAAQGVMASYKEKALGTIGHIGCYSFQETKNYSMGEGGAILINDSSLIERAEIIIEKGTDKSKFLRGEIKAYSWVDIGSSYVPAAINAAYLYAQLENAEIINEDRLNAWNLYSESLSSIEKQGKIELMHTPEECIHNAHMFYIKCKDYDEREELISYLKNEGVITVFHYIPLHNSKAGGKYTRLAGEDKYTTIESRRILRLPMYYKLGSEKIKYICEKIRDFYEERQ